jgi:membrane protease YdiL (CAAX protease family)
VSLGASGVSAFVSLIGSLTARHSLASQSVTLNGSQAPGRPLLDLFLQLASLASGAAPVVLAFYLLARATGPMPSPSIASSSGRTEGSGGTGARGDGGREPPMREVCPPGVIAGGLSAIGVDRSQPLRDLGRGAALAALLGGTGLGLYFAAYKSGIALNIVAENLPAVWWRIPVLLLSALQNGLLEEVLVTGYLLTRLRKLGVHPAAAVAISATLRGSYHLYQGFGGFAGNAALGVVFAVLFLRWRRATPMIIAHTLIDAVAFVGYLLLAGHVSWLP